MRKNDAICYDDFMMTRDTGILADFRLEPQPFVAFNYAGRSPSPVQPCPPQSGPALMPPAVASTEIPNST